MTVAQLAAIRTDTAARRCADLLLASVLLVLLAPLFLAVAVAIRLDSDGPICYRAVRVGRGGALFQMLKFRSMQPDADRVGPGVSGRSDSRVTRVGQLLRATKLDELPQLLNVLNGTMTLVGPRAESPRYWSHYTAAEGELGTVRPGLTGPGQLGFTLRQAAELDDVADPDSHYIDHQLHDKLAIDLAYLRDRRVLRDAEILVATLTLVLRTMWIRASAPLRRVAKSPAVLADHCGGAVTALVCDPDPPAPASPRCGPQPR